MISICDVVCVRVYVWCPINRYIISDLPEFLACATVVHFPYSSALVEQLEYQAESNVQTGKEEPRSGYTALIQLHMYSCDGPARQDQNPSTPPVTRY